MRAYCHAKIHDIVVTECILDYEGSVEIDSTLLRAAGIEPYEVVHVVNLSSGERWTTYALPSDVRGRFSLNGGGARLGLPGDKCVVMAFSFAERFSGQRVVYCAGDNSIARTVTHDSSCARDR